MSDWDCRLFTDAQFAQLGLNRMAYVKAVPDADGEIVYQVHAAEGTVIAELTDHGFAVAAIRDNDMEPVSIH